MHYQVEVIREHLSPAQVLEIRAEAKREGHKVNVTRLLNGLVEVEIRDYQKSENQNQGGGLLLN